MSTAVVVSTYNSPEPLRKTLLGLLAQTERDFRTFVSDDGSTPETEYVLRLPEFAGLDIEHVWQPDDGWRRPRALNYTFARCDADYIIHIDGDTIPRADFVESHLRARRPRTYVSGARVGIPGHVHREFTDDDILSNRVFDVEFLAACDPKLAGERGRLHAGRWAMPLNYLTWRHRTLTGCNFSVWREAVLAINGFDESFDYSCDDREFGMRLSNNGCRSRWLKYSLVQLHLNHPRNINLAQCKRNRRRFRKLFFTGKTRVEPGIDTVIERVEDEIRRKQAA
ncbi:MAG: glycosyltransferase [Pirellulales bacterium]|nr:glycosyltransferase [Pirellulales bacterium]